MKLTTKLFESARGAGMVRLIGSCERGASEHWFNLRRGSMPSSQRSFGLEEEL